MRKILIAILVILIVIIGYVLLKLKMRGDQQISDDQITFQYDREIISPHKRALSFDHYELDAFDKYDMIHQLIHGQDIASIQAYLSEGSFTTVELCRYYLTRVKNYSEYNTVIQLNPNVLLEAQVIDDKIASGNTQSLYGVVVLIKDNIAAVNMNTSSGAYALKDLTTTRDAAIVENLKTEDALILGKANLSEWSNFMTMPSSNGFSALGGQTKNAYGRFDVGGSSSGSSAAAALSLSTIAIGTETSGSLIYPAGQNSVAALKPTVGLLSRDLIIPIAEAQDTAGIISRNVLDLNTVFNAIIKEDSYDHATDVIKDYKPQVDLREDYLKGKRIGLYDSGAEELKTIVSELERLGTVVVAIQIDENANNIDMISVLSHGIVHDVKAFLNNPAVQTSYQSLDEIVAFNNDNDEAIPYGQYLLENALQNPVTDAEEIIENNKSVTSQALDDVFESDDLDAILSMSNDLSGIYAPAGYPALTLPTGYRDDGEPYGLTLVGQFLHDQELINMAYAYEFHNKVRKEID